MGVFFILILTATPHPPPHHIYARAYLYYIIAHGDLGGIAGRMSTSDQMHADCWDETTKKRTRLLKGKSVSL